MTVQSKRDFDLKIAGSGDSQTPFLNYNKSNKTWRLEIEDEVTNPRIKNPVRKAYSNLKEKIGIFSNKQLPSPGSDDFRIKAYKGDIGHGSPPPPQSAHIPGLPAAAASPTRRHAFPLNTELDEITEESPKAVPKLKLLAALRKKWQKRRLSSAEAYSSEKMRPSILPKVLKTSFRFQKTIRRAATVDNDCNEVAMASTSPSAEDNMEDCLPTGTEETLDPSNKTPLEVFKNMGTASWNAVKAALSCCFSSSTAECIGGNHHANSDRNDTAVLEEMHQTPMQRGIAALEALGKRQKSAASLPSSAAASVRVPSVQVDQFIETLLAALKAATERKKESRSSKVVNFTKGLFKRPKRFWK